MKKCIVIGNLRVHVHLLKCWRGTCWSVGMLKGYMAGERLGTPGLLVDPALLETKDDYLRSIYTDVPGVAARDSLFVLLRPGVAVPSRARAQKYPKQQNKQRITPGNSWHILSVDWPLRGACYSKGWEPLIQTFLLRIDTSLDFQIWEFYDNIHHDKNLFLFSSSTEPT